MGPVVLFVFLLMISMTLVFEIVMDIINKTVNEKSIEMWLWTTVFGTATAFAYDWMVS